MVEATSTRGSAYHAMGLATVLLSVVGCGVPRAYDTPRTTPVGKLSHSVVVEVGDSFFGRDKDDHALVAPDGYLPAYYSMRLGIFDRLDVSASLGTLLLAGEMKWNFLRSSLVDAAIAPRAQYYQPLSTSAAGAGLVTLSLPALWGINISRRVSLILVPALIYADSHRPSEYNSTTDMQDPAEDEHGLVGALGSDINLRLADRFAIQPGFTLYRPLAEDVYRWQFGLAFNFGSLPMR